MGKRLIPPKGSLELGVLVSEYPTCSPIRLAELAEFYGYTSVDTFCGAMLKVAGTMRKPPSDDLVGKLTLIEQQILGIVQAGAVSVGEISRQIDRSSETVIKTIDALRERSYEVALDEISGQVEIPQTPTKIFGATEIKYFRKFYRIGIVSDTQICSKYQQLTLLHDAYKDFDNRQVDFILHAGDIVDGQDMYRGHTNEIHTHGSDAQKDYVIQHYPQAQRNRKTYLVGGQHDFCYFKQNGYNILTAICEKRRDLKYRGFFDAKFKVRGLEVGLHHPGGGVAYARSYKIQKYIENMVGFITSIPSATAPILQLFGHWHIPCHLPSYMGIDAVSLPCFQSQTPYLAEKGLMPVVGYAIAEIYLGKDDTLVSTKIEFINMNARIIERDY